MSRRSWSCDVFLLTLALSLIMAGCTQSETKTQNANLADLQSKEPLWHTPPSARWDELARKYVDPPPRPAADPVAELLDYARAFHMYRTGQLPHPSQNAKDAKSEQDTKIAPPPSANRRTLMGLRPLFSRVKWLALGKNVPDSQMRLLIPALIELQMDLSLVAKAPARARRETVSLKANLLLRQITELRLLNPNDELALDWPANPPKAKTLPTIAERNKRLSRWTSWWNTSREDW